LKVRPQGDRMKRFESHDDLRVIVEELRMYGAEYFVIPSAAKWYGIGEPIMSRRYAFDMNSNLRIYLESRYTKIVDDAATVIFDVREARGSDRDIGF